MSWVILGTSSHHDTSVFKIAVQSCDYLHTYHGAYHLQPLQGSLLSAHGWRTPANRAMNIIPRNQAQAAIIRTLNNQDHFYPYRTWPYELRRIAINQNRGYQQRWFYVAFLFWNGLRTDLIGHWLRMGQSNWSPSRENHVTNLIRSMERGRAFPRTIWDMDQGRYVHPPQTANY